MIEGGPPYNGEVFARAYVDMRTATPYKIPGITMRIGEDHIGKLAEAAVGHLSTTITACNTQAYGKRTQNENTHPTTFASLENEDVPALPTLQRKAHQDIQDLSDPDKKGKLETRENLKSEYTSKRPSYTCSKATGKQ